MANQGFWRKGRWTTIGEEKKRKWQESHSKPRKSLPPVYVSHRPSANLVAFMARHGVTVLEVPANERIGPR